MVVAEGLLPVTLKTLLVVKVLEAKVIITTGKNPPSFTVTFSVVEDCINFTSFTRLYSYTEICAESLCILKGLYRYLNRVD